MQLVLHNNNVISGAIISTSEPIGLHFFTESEKQHPLMNGYTISPYELIIQHFLLGVSCYMGHERELNFCLLTKSTFENLFKK